MVGTISKRIAPSFKFATLFLIYVATAKLGLQLDAVGGFASLVWPPTGIALAALLLFGRRMWTAIALGAFVVNITSGAPLLVATGIAVGNTLEAVLSALVLERAFAFEPSLGRARHVLALALPAAVGCTAISAIMGAGCLWAGGIIEGSDVIATGRAWWVGDALGDLIIAPALLVWARAPHFRGRVVEAITIAAALVLVALYIFDVVFPRSQPEDIRSPYLVFPPLIYASLRFRQHGAATGTLLVWIVSIVATSLGLGPFVAARLSESLLALQLFMSVVAISMLLLASAVCEHDRAIQRAETAEQRNARLYDEARQGVRARDVFLAVASHELRTPLTSLGLQVSNLRALVAEDATTRPTILAKLDVIDRQSDRLGALVENLLDVSQVVSGQVRMANDKVNMSSVVREVVSRFSEQAARAGCELLVDVNGISPVRGDRVRIEQILTNVLGNAIKFGRGRPIRISLARTPGIIEVAVRDQGGGIAAEDHERIFQQFERASSHKPAGGLGLGLWIARQLAVAMGGSIHVESELGSGATFILELPEVMRSTALEELPS